MAMAQHSMEEGRVYPFGKLPKDSRFAWETSPEMFPFIKKTRGTYRVLLMGDQLGDGVTERISPATKVVYCGHGT